MVIAQTLDGLLDDQDMEQILDRESNIDATTEKILKDWNYDLYSRNPAPAYNATGMFHGTNLDLATIMSALADRNAVINIPEYTGRRAKTHKEDEWVVSPENRHGNITGVAANKDVFSFSVRIFDQNVVNRKTNETGAYRNFLLTDLNGDMYNGWSTIEFSPTAKENDFLKDKELYTGNSIVVKNFVHPNAWCAFYGAPYIKSKALEQRLTQEAQHYRMAAKNLKDIGVRAVDEDVRYDVKKVADIYKEPGRKIKVPTFKAELDVPAYTGEFPGVDANAEGLAYAQNRASTLSYSIIPKLRFRNRAVELAFNKYGNGNNGLNKPGWNVPEWESGYKLGPRAKNTWNRLDIGNGFGLRYKTGIKTETVK
ncbi:MAG: hypothetical protein JSW73_04200 [Candidatus Woesearchaeota archaeon]|nr:MAG: hypothetical protein JSW73_04200 [Candidatus Woesearchaeota archaeon]